MPWMSLWALTLFSLTLVHAQVDNGIVGDPIVDCGDNFFEVRFETRTTFRGLVFVDEMLNDPDCRSPPADSNGVRNTSLRLSFNKCGVQRRLSDSPRGLFITTKIIVAFHPEFLTKVDRVYIVQCFYMEMERRLEKEIQIIMPNPTLQTANVPMPVCRYEVLDSSPTGPPVFFTTVGQMVYHKWTCETDHPDTFCMKVHSCTVDDGNGDRVMLLDEHGCAQDKYLLNNLEYISDLMAGREAHVYKYADRENMYFDCQITISIKEPEQEYCEYPNCPDPPRRRRSEFLKLINGTTSEKSTGTSEMAHLETHEPALHDFIIDEESIVKAGFLKKNFDVSQEGFCMSGIGASSVLFFNISLIFLSAIIMYFSFASPSKH